LPHQPQDISSYNEMQTLEEAQEESGWKLVHGDVFRPPSTSPMMLSVMAGTCLLCCLTYTVKLAEEIVRLLCGFHRCCHV
jgi:transmembrane 9 superfamily protein 2/4